MLPNIQISFDDIMQVKWLRDGLEKQRAEMVLAARKREAGSGGIGHATHTFDERDVERSIETLNRILKQTNQ